MADEPGTADEGVEGVATSISPAGACGAPVRGNPGFCVEGKRPFDGIGWKLGRSDSLGRENVFFSSVEFDIGGRNSRTLPNG